MHKKSIEAAQKFKDEEDTIDIVTSRSPSEVDGTGNMSLDKEEFRSESIASLRAKAQTYSAKIRGETLPPSPTRPSTTILPDVTCHANTSRVESTHGILGSSFEAPPHDESTCDSETLDPVSN